MNQYQLTKNELEFVQKVQADLAAKTKHNKISIEKIAANFSVFNKNKIKELTELAIVRIARQISQRTDISDILKYDLIVNLYNNQVNLSQRTSQSMLLQQYSTPAPISYIASLFVAQDDHSIYFEPSAGNGLLTIALPYENTYVNELDDVRLANLYSQPFAIVTTQDATIPFTDYYKKFDGIVTNPPFGTLMEAENYDGFKIKTLDHLMSLRALDCMKDTGRAAIIIGGHTEWDEQGRIQAGKNRLFFNYLYSHYNVEDVILIDGHKLYSRQGTSFNTRLILINGRKQKIEGFSPLKNSLISEIVSDFEKLWKRVFFAQAKVPANHEAKAQANSDIDIDNEIEVKKELNILKLKLKLKAKALDIDNSLSGYYYKKRGKLSAYTISDNCADITDINTGIQEIRDAIKEREIMSQKIPYFFYIRLTKLQAKALKLI